MTHTASEAWRLPEYEARPNRALHAVEDDTRQPEAVGMTVHAGAAKLMARVLESMSFDRAL
jgi:hypothetical protein